MPAIISPDVIKRALSDPENVARFVELVARKTKKVKSGKGKTKIKGGVIAGIVIAIIVAIIVLAIILFLLRRNRRKKIAAAPAH
ncbi:hypothetical protein BU24DRAFT_429350 [Aaosphaeria arxii CBS 175.79]|uniref:Uncharacterized protein n=1 Tax=Aaosphaeria arxii CBS 175.79 TaxID=1450172 RepID=A0A6A5X6E3_9PLEO|nr:uncharacterized protein BU24DRAFT_429350 [Aaosphaeria arxii CBS 175.79]KAF2008519.1 hypothetical protein BU24DRAFT_429350 [Aaosphaeria arxii CBS 175.79]